MIEQIIEYDWADYWIQTVYILHFLYKTITIIYDMKVEVTKNCNSLHNIHNEKNKLH